MQAVGFQTGNSYCETEDNFSMSKLRKRETIGFRPDNDAQDKLIRDAQKATGIKMSDLLRLACLRGLPSVVAEVKQQQQAAFNHFEETLRETNVDVTLPAAAPDIAKPDPRPYKISRKPLRKVS